jgi:hypothetical protein
MHGHPQVGTDVLGGLQVGHYAEGNLERRDSLIRAKRYVGDQLDSVSGQGGDQFFLHLLPSAVPEALESWLRIGYVCYRNLHDSATYHFGNSSRSVRPSQLITQRSLIQIQPSLPSFSRASDVEPVVRSPFLCPRTGFQIFWIF